MNYNYNNPYNQYSYNAYQNNNMHPNQNYGNQHPQNNKIMVCINNHNINNLIILFLF